MAVILAASGLVAGLLALMSHPASGGAARAAVFARCTPLSREETTGTLILPHVTATIPLIPGIGFGPSAIGVNPVTGYVYVANSWRNWQHNWESHAVSILSGTQVITNIQVPGRPLDVVVNPTSGYVYVTLDTDDLAVLSGTRIITILPGVGGTVHAVNPTTGLVYTAEPEGELVSVLSGTKMVATMTVASGLRDMKAAPDSGLIYVAAYPQDGTLIYQGALTVLSGTQVITTVTGLTGGPTAVGVNPINGYVYVANSLTDTVTVVSGTDVIATVPTGYNLAYWAGGAVEVDPTTGYVYVMGHDEAPFYGFVTVLSGTQRVKTIVGPTRPTAITINPANSRAYVTYKLCYHCEMFGYFTTTMLVLSGAEISAVVDIDGDSSAVAANPTNGYIYVATAREGGSSVVMLSGTQTIATAQGRSQNMVEVDPGSGRIYVQDLAHRSVTIIEDGRIIADVEVDMLPLNLAVNPTTGLVYVTGYLPHTWTGTVAILSDIQVIARLNAGMVPVDVEVAPSHDYIYVAQYGGSVTVLSGTRIITTVAVGVYTNTTGPSVIKANPVNGYVYVGSSNGISVVSETQVITLISTGDYYDIRFIDVDPLSGYVYAVGVERPDDRDRVSNVCILSDTQVITHVTVEGSPTAFTVNPVNGYAYVATDNKRMAILSRVQVITTFPMAAQINAIAANPASGYVYAANSNNTVSVLSGTKVVKTLSVGDYPVDIAIHPATGMVYVVNYYGQSITVIADVPVPLFRMYLPLTLRAAQVPCSFPRSVVGTAG